MSVVEFFGVVVAIIAQPNHMNHFTWWGLAAFGIYSFLSFANPAAADAVWGIPMTLSSAIIVGVVALSSVQCDLLINVLSDLGGSGYILGNFSVHYWPLLRLYFCRPKNIVRRRYILQSVYGVSLVLVYVSAEDANNVYGCGLSARAVTFASLGTVVVPVAVWRVVRLGHR